MQLENTNSQALFEVTGARKIVQMKQICQENSLDMGVLEVNKYFFLSIFAQIGSFAYPISSFRLLFKSQQRLTTKKELLFISLSEPLELYLIW